MFAKKIAITLFLASASLGATAQVSQQQLQDLQTSVNRLRVLVDAYTQRTAPAIGSSSTRADILRALPWCEPNVNVMDWGNPVCKPRPQAARTITIGGPKKPLSYPEYIVWRSQAREVTRRLTGK
jgi:hypothetical protein